ncbi:GtrA family protein [Plantactinospora siamensis]|uniref:GtrA family protein n=1 Tax=Plantactinospora siamensis TaxID=555372 RepID=A0ABV6NWY0_9ACTN
MRLVRMLPERWQKLAHEALKFGTVGGINTLINYVVFNALALTVMRNGQLKATIIANVVAAICSFMMNRHWTYRDRPKSALHRETALFFLFNGIGLIIELGALGLAKYGFGITGLLALNVAKTGGLVLGTLFRFWAYRNFVFRPAPAAVDGHVEHHLVADLDPVAELVEELETEHHQRPTGPTTDNGRAGTTANERVGAADDGMAGAADDARVSAADGPAGRPR